MAVPTPLNVTNSGNNTASTSWSVTLPAYSTGDLILIHVASDDSVNVIALTYPSGPNGETITKYVDRYGHTDSTPDQRIDIGWYIATANYGGGSITLTPSASETWTATVIRIAAGDFDANNPISTASVGTGSGTSTTDTTVESGAFTANADDGDGLLLFWYGVDADPSGAQPSGWTALASIDRGAQSGTLARRTAGVTASESIAQSVRNIAGDSWCGWTYIVRAAPVSGDAETVSASLTLPSLTAAGSADVEAPEFEASSALTFSALTLSASADVEAPQVEASAALTLAALTSTATTDVASLDQYDLYVQLFLADGSTPMSNEVLVANDAALSSSYDEYDVELTLQGSYTVEQWAGAQLKLRWQYSDNGIPITVRVTSVELEAIASVTSGASAELLLPALSASANASVSVTCPLYTKGSSGLALGASKLSVFDGEGWRGYAYRPFPG